jgi:hypothetical protein
MANRKRITKASGLLLQSLMLNAAVLLLNLPILLIYSLVRGAAFIDLLLGGGFELLLLLESGILLLTGGGYVLTSGIFFGEMRGRVFRGEGWSPEEFRRSEGRALPIVLAGALVLAESIALALV